MSLNDEGTAGGKNPTLPDELSCDAPQRCGIGTLCHLHSPTGNNQPRGRKINQVGARSTQRETTRRQRISKRIGVATVPPLVLGGLSRGTGPPPPAGLLQRHAAVGTSLAVRRARCRQWQHMFVSLPPGRLQHATPCFWRGLRVARTLNWYRYVDPAMLYRPERPGQDGPRNPAIQQHRVVTHLHLGIVEGTASVTGPSRTARQILCCGRVRSKAFGSRQNRVGDGRRAKRKERHAPARTGHGR